VLAGIDMNFDCVRDINVVMRPCPSPADILRVDKIAGAIDDSVQFPGTRPIDGHMDVIDTEIVSMCLTSPPFVLAAGVGGPSTFPLLPTKGAVAETPGDPTLADSFFDVFFELQGIPGGPAYNQSPMVVQSQITCLPPADNYVHLIGLCLPLFSKGVCVGGSNDGNPCAYDANCPGGTCAGEQHLANLVAANHSVNEPVCAAPQFPACGGNCPPGEVCQQSPTQGCECMPLPCNTTEPPQCDGACPPGQSCLVSTTGDVCVCHPSPCEGTFPSCDGPCPAPLECRGIPGTNLCACEPPQDPPCSQAAPPQCGGVCPNTTDICIPNTDGTTGCHCEPPQQDPCNQSAPLCDGVCPVPGDLCVADAVGCHCEPPPDHCDQTYPACDGPCPVAGETCVQNTATQMCDCQAPPDHCDQTYPACDGPCPLPGEVCVPNTDGTPGCHCDGPPGPCEQSVPACDGFCPDPGETCVVDAAGCHCEPPPEPCDLSAPACDGLCPTPGDICVPNTITDGCHCEPPPPPQCNQSLPPACGGICPPGQVCKAHPSGTSCACCPKPPPPTRVTWHSKIIIKWNAVIGLPCFVHYNVYEKLGALPDVDHDGVAEDYGSCLGSVQNPEYDHTTTPMLGEVAYIQITAETDAGEGDMGTASNGLPRPNVSPCP
jgi:hypothetical protein